MNNNGVNTDRLELPTSGLGVRCSIQLSYAFHYESHVDAILVYTIANSSQLIMCHHILPYYSVRQPIPGIKHLDMLLYQYCYIALFICIKTYVFIITQYFTQLLKLYRTYNKTTFTYIHWCINRISRNITNSIVRMN